jgi:hypothetical protein
MVYLSSEAYGEKGYKLGNHHFYNPEYPLGIWDYFLILFSYLEVFDAASTTGLHFWIALLDTRGLRSRECNTVF